MTQEITIPLDLKRVVLMGAEETKLGDKKGALKQYRKGNLHIREYEDRFTVHADKVDPREDPMGHLIHDAQEVLVGLAGAAISGATNASFSKMFSFATVIGISKLIGYEVRNISATAFAVEQKIPVETTMSKLIINEE